MPRMSLRSYDRRLQLEFSKQSLAHVIFGKEQETNAQSFLI